MQPRFDSKKMKNKTKCLIVRIIYVLIWSFGLLYASFPKFFLKGGNGISWGFQETMDNVTKTEYIFPYIMAMLLFLIDVIYSFILEKWRGKENRIIETLIGVSAFMFCFIMSLSYGKWIFFIIGWFCLTIIKFLKTDSGIHLDISDTQPDIQVSKVDDK